MNKTKILSIYTKLYSITHKVKKRILFSSYGGAQYSDSPRVICEKMHEMYPDYELIWMFENPDEKVVPKYVIKVARKSLKYYEMMATCCAYVTNEDLKEGQFKRKGQYFVQCWHADRPLKKILYEIEDYNLIVADEYLTDLCVSASDFGDSMYERAFRYKGKILSNGMPRNDILFNYTSKQIEMIRKKLGINEEKKVLLFAPTFRDNMLKNFQKISVDIERAMRILNERQDWICLMRAHTGVKEFDFKCDGERYIDVTEYDEIGELFLISDCLITDYSSCATDFILLKRPTILATFDLDEYIENCRELIDGFDNMGFVIAKNQEQLNSLLENYDTIDGVEEYKKVADFFGIHESGNSACQICELIHRNMKNCEENTQ